MGSLLSQADIPLVEDGHELWAALQRYPDPKKIMFWRSWHRPKQNVRHPLKKDVQKNANCSIRESKLHSMSFRRYVDTVHHPISKAIAAPEWNLLRLLGSMMLGGECIQL